jgi:hypothetical protein
LLALLCGIVIRMRRLARFARVVLPARRWNSSTSIAPLVLV